MRLVATWKQTQDECNENPIDVRWEDGSPATLADFRRIDTSSQSYPEIIGNEIVTFSYEIQDGPR